MTRMRTAFCQWLVADTKGKIFDCRFPVKDRLVFRCLVWVIAKLTHVWDVQIELTGSMVGYSSEVDEVFKSPSHSFC